jgi:mono/diheme cytochrome c family protein
MPAMGATMDDRQLAAVLYYIRNSWGNKGSKVTAEQVKKVRAELGGRSDAHTAEELLKLPDAL